jgi:hypothetical protein
MAEANPELAESLAIEMFARFSDLRANDNPNLPVNGPIV